MSVDAQSNVVPHGKFVLDVNGLLTVKCGPWQIEKYFDISWIFSTV